MPIGMVTLRSDTMWDMVDRLFNVALPRRAPEQYQHQVDFDGHGNYTLGMREQLISPELEYDRIDNPQLETVLLHREQNQEARRCSELLA